MLLIPDRAFRDLLFPRIEGKQLRLYRQKATSRWITGPFGLKEPDPESWEIASPREVDLALIPGLAFDFSGGRLGRGGGFYDRLLSLPDFQGKKIGLCWTWQIVPSIPCEDHDIRMDQILTEENFHLTAPFEGSMLDNSQERE
jgi:5-formyltetrahydrofolate cyclo-ligase